MERCSPGFSWLTGWIWICYAWGTIELPMTIHACCVIILPRKPWQFSRVTWPNSDADLRCCTWENKLGTNPCSWKLSLLPYRDLYGEKWQVLQRNAHASIIQQITSLLIHACTPSEDHNRPEKSSLLKLCMIIYMRHLCLCCLLFESIVNGYQNFL